MTEHRFRFSRLSTLLIVAGLALLAWGLVTLVGQRPTAAEQAALARGQVVSRQMEVAADQARPALLPAPGVASLAEAVPTSAPTAALRPAAESSGEPIGDLPLDVPGRSRPSSVPGSRREGGRAAPTRIPAHSPPTRIVAPTIGLDSPVVEVGWQVVEQDGKPVSVWEVADYAAGFHKTSAYPGNPGNTVLSGHHNIKGEVFRYLVELDVGDPVYLYAEGRQYAYRVVDRFIVQEAGASLEQRRRNARWIAPTPPSVGRTGDERLTLVTCWPYWANTYRVIVIAEPATEAREPPGPDAWPRAPRE